MTEGMPQGEPSRLDEVVDALIDLNAAENSAYLAQAGHAQCPPTPIHQRKRLEDGGDAHD